MKAIWMSLKVLIISTLAAQTAMAVEQSFPVKCRFFQVGENLRPPLRDGDFLVQTVGDVTSLRLRSGQEELSITVRRGFDQGRRGSEPTVQALEGTFDSQKYVLFFRDGVVIQQRDSLGKPLAVMSCQSGDIPKIADRLLGTDEGRVGIMEASMVQLTNGIARTPPANAPSGSSTTAPSVMAPAVPVPVAPPVIVPTQVTAPSVTSNGLPPGMAENLEIIQGQN